MFWPERFFSCVSIVLRPFESRIVFTWDQSVYFGFFERNFSDPDCPREQDILEYRRRLFLTRLGADCIISVEVDAGNYLPYRLSYGYSSHLPSLSAYLVRLCSSLNFLSILHGSLLYLSVYLIHLSVYLSFFLDSLTLQLWRDGKEVEKGLCPTKVVKCKNNLVCLLRPLMCGSASSLLVSGPGS
jgi:hypothetical protein